MGDAPTTKNLTLQCMVNDYRAPVRWFKGDQEIVEDGKHFIVDKDFIGNCKLTIVRATKDDSGMYKCKIDNTKSVTKTTVNFEGFRLRFWLFLLYCYLYIENFKCAL